ncbi:hypothetical protein C8J57DRAFT_1527714 [Mycena rebaudengoi]|nr:hypothetical protein C8J57DRAFT_1527714 [Mycena rebaudengoi]
MTDFTVVFGPDGMNYTICVITNGGVILGSNIDMIYGDSFLRNVYTVFSFGNDTVAGHVQLLSQTDKAFPCRHHRPLRRPIPASAAGEVSSANLVAAADTEIGSPSSTDSQITKYAPIVIGLLGANLLLLVVVALIGIVGCVRNGRQVGPVWQYAPVKVREEDVYEQKAGRYSDGPH